MKNRSTIKRKLIAMVGTSLLLVTGIFLIMFFTERSKIEYQIYGEEKGEVSVFLNEVDNILREDLGEAYTGTRSEEKLRKFIYNTSYNEGTAVDNNLFALGIFYITSVICLVITYGMIYVLVLRPFSKLEVYAEEISTGNLDVDLKYQRVNVFGEFTWAFDHMRQEIKRARQCEQEAVSNNKTIIATLSHDIKTPIASIRAYSEALEENMDSTPERRQRYIDVIIRKCDEVTKITNDMFIHSLHDLDKLIIKKEDVEIHKVITDTVEAMQGNREDIVLKDIKKCNLSGCDRERIAQVLENLINNARKYAPGKIYIDTELVCDLENERDVYYMISIKDTGEGIPDCDMPFIFDKFYRGKNHGDQPGSGLGLFIVRYVMEQMGGNVTITNHDDGMEVKLFLKNQTP